MRKEIFLTAVTFIALAAGPCLVAGEAEAQAKLSQEEYDTFVAAVRSKDRDRLQAFANAYPDSVLLGALRSEWLEFDEPVDLPAGVGSVSISAPAPTRVLGGCQPGTAPELCDGTDRERETSRLGPDPVSAPAPGSPRDEEQASNDDNGGDRDAASDDRDDDNSGRGSDNSGRGSDDDDDDDRGGNSGTGGGRNDDEDDEDRDDGNSGRGNGGGWNNGGGRDRGSVGESIRDTLESLTGRDRGRGQGRGRGDD